MPTLPVILSMLRISASTEGKGVFRPPRSLFLDLHRAPAVGALPEDVEVALALVHPREPRVLALASGLLRPLEADLARGVLHLGIELGDDVARLLVEVERLGVLLADLEPALEGHELRHGLDELLVGGRELVPRVLVDAKLERRGGLVHARVGEVLR